MPHISLLLLLTLVYILHIRGGHKLNYETKNQQTSPVHGPVHASWIAEMKHQTFSTLHSILLWPNRCPLPPFCCPTLPTPYLILPPPLHLPSPLPSSEAAAHQEKCARTETAGLVPGRWVAEEMEALGSPPHRHEPEKQTTNWFIFLGFVDNHKL